MITIEWTGPDKAMRTFIEDRIDALFFDATFEVRGLQAATSAIEFTSRVR